MTTFSRHARPILAGILRAPKHIRRTCRIETLEVRRLLSITPDQTSAAAAYGQLPLSFEANEGQTSAQVNYLARGGGYTLFLTPSEAVLGLAAGGSQSEQVNYVAMQLIGGNSAASATGEAKLPGVTNYLVGNDPSHWHTNIANYGQVSYSNVYPGINLVYYGNQQQLEYDFDVAAGADPSAIKLQFPGAQSLSLDPAGNLILQAGGGQVTLDKPNVYQTLGGVRHDVGGSFTINGQQIGFQLGAYDHSQALVIDPTIAYGTYLGGHGLDWGYSIAVDDFGDAFVAGETVSADFPITAGAFQTSSNPGQAAFVTVFNPQGTGIIYSTYLGGQPSDPNQITDLHANGVAVDSTTGDAYVIVQDTAGAFPGGGSLWVLNPKGTGLVYSTTLPGTANGVAVDGKGDAYVTGEAGPGFQALGGVSDSLATRNKPLVAYVEKIDPTQTGAKSIVYSADFGGSTNATAGAAIAVDGLGEAYIAGGTSATDLLSSLGASGVQSSYGGDTNGNSGFAIGATYADGFVVKLSADGSKTLAATYLGGAGDDIVNGIALDGNNNVYVIGTTTSGSFPGVSPVLKSTASDSVYDAFVAQLSPDLSKYGYMTFLGAAPTASLTYGSAVAVDSNGNAYAVGTTYGPGFPIVGPQQTSPGSGFNAFLTELNPSGKVGSSTLLGGKIPNPTTLPPNGSATWGLGVAVDSNDEVYVTGASSAASLLPVTAAATAFQPTNFGHFNEGPGTNAYVLKFNPRQETIVVNSTGDAPSQDGIGPETGNQVTLDNGDQVPEITLRSAIQAVDAAPGQYRITFAIPAIDPGYDAATGGFVIHLMQSLPTINNPVDVDGTSQPGFAGSTVLRPRRIVLDGAGLVINGGDSRVSGLVIDSSSANGIWLNSDHNLVAGNYIGIDVTGMLPAGNTFDGILVTGSDNQIGGATPAARNVICANGDSFGSGGVVIGNTPGVDTTITGNIVEGNYIGTAPGVVDPRFAHLSNYSGIVLHASGNLIGGLDTPSEGNVITASINAGIENYGTNLISANIIGTMWAVDALGDIGGNHIGIFVHQSADNVTGSSEIGGLGNIIAGNDIGIQVEASASIANNLIGAMPQMPPSGVEARLDWVPTLQQTLLGQNSWPGGNPVGNITGVILTPVGSSTIQIEGNEISFNSDGTPIGPGKVGDPGTGIAIENGSAGLLIGHNTISDNTGEGIFFSNQENPSALNVGLLDNSIYGNGGLGVDLAGTHTPLPDVNLLHDYFDLPNGANHLLQAPIISSAVASDGGTVVNWSYFPIINQPVDAYAAEFFDTDPATIAAAGSSPQLAQGEFVLGTTFRLGAADARLGVRQNETTTLPEAISRNSLISAMLQIRDARNTSDVNDTSEYSAAVPVVPPDNAVGPSGYGSQHFVNGDPAYTLVFENPASASAPAKAATITDRLDANLDASTFALGAISVAGVSVVAPKGSQSFNTQLDLTATQGVLVNINASLDTTTRTATWTFQAIDPHTGQPPTDPTVGFLPPNTDGLSGEVFVTYTITPKAGLATGTTINSQAQFSMDGGTAITTPNSFNTIDSGPPTSSVAPLAAVTNSTGVVVNWSGQDDAGGSGIASYDVYVSDNGGPFTLWQNATPATSAIYNGQYGHTYGFYSTATDNVGNVQPTPAAAQATTQLEPPQLAVVSSQAPGAADRGGAQDSTTELYNSEGVINLDDALPTSSEISSDGRYFVFTSSAPNLVPGMPTPTSDTFGFDENGIQVYRYDRLTGTVALVSTSTAGGAPDNVSFDPVISADGRYVAFVSQADDLVSNFTPSPANSHSTDNVYVRDMQTGATVLASPSVFAAAGVNEGIQTDDSNVGIKGLSISANGQFVAFYCAATDLVSGVTLNSGSNIYVRDLVNQKTIAADPVASGQSAASPPNGAGVVTAISADGRYVAFTDDATNLVSGVTMSSGENVYVRDLVVGTTTLVTVNAAGTASSQNTNLSDEVTISADGRYVLFASNATDLVATPSGGKLNVYLRDLVNNTTTLVSVDSAGSGGGNGDSQYFALSGNEQAVVFESTATNLATGATGVGDVYVRNLQTGTTTLASVDQAGTAGGNKTSWNSFYDNAPPAISNDGTIVAFDSQASNLAPNTPTAYSNVFVRDLASGTTTLVTGQPAFATSTDIFGAPSASPPLLTPDGKTVVFSSIDSDLVPNTGSGQSNVYLSDWQTGPIALVSAHGPGLASATSGSSESGRNGDLAGSEAPQYYQTTSSDGRFVVYTSTVPYLVAGIPLTTQTQQINGQTTITPVQEVYLHDLTTGANSLVSADAAGTAGGNGASGSPVISGNGQYVTFISQATNLASDATNGNDQVYVRNVQTGVTTLVSVAANGSGGGDGNSGEHGGSFLFGAITDLAISADGRYIVFASTADNLIAGVKTQGANLFLRDMQTGTTTLITATASGTGTGANSYVELAGQGITPDGNHILFESNNANLIAGTTTGGGTNLLVYDVQTGTTTLVSIGANGSASGGMNDGGRDAAITPDGRYVAFASSAANLVSPATKKNGHLFARSRGRHDHARQRRCSERRPAVDLGGRAEGRLRRAGRVQCCLRSLSLQCRLGTTQPCQRQRAKHRTRQRRIRGFRQPKFWQ